MSKVAEVASMDINFESEHKEKEFVRWANDNSTANRKEMIDLRKRIQEVRKIRNGFKHNWKDIK